MEPEDRMHYVLPLTAFAAGIFIAERIESRYKSSRTLHWRQIILLIEIVMLSIVGFMTKELNMLANMMVSFSCAMEVQTFRKVHGITCESAALFWHHIDLCHRSRHWRSSVESDRHQDNLGLLRIVAGRYADDGEGKRRKA